MPLSHYALNTFVAQEFADLKAPGAKPIGHEFPTRDSWLESFVLNSIFTSPVSPSGAALAFAWMRRASAAVEDYDAACASLQASAAGKNRVSEYFRALGKFESAIAMLYQAHDFARKALEVNLFKKGDGTFFERLNSIYNRSRHAELVALPSGHLHPIWIRDDGIYTEGASLTFSEIEESLKELGSIAHQIANGARSISEPAG